MARVVTRMDQNIPTAQVVSVMGVTVNRAHETLLRWAPQFLMFCLLFTSTTDVLKITHESSGLGLLTLEIMLISTLFCSSSFYRLTFPRLSTIFFPLFFSLLFSSFLFSPSFQISHSILCHHLRLHALVYNRLRHLLLVWRGTHQSQPMVVTYSLFLRLRCFCSFDWILGCQAKGSKQAANVCVRRGLRQLLLVYVHSNNILQCLHGRQLLRSPRLHRTI